MTLLTANRCWKINGGNCFGRLQKSEVSSRGSIPQLRFRANVKAFAARKSAKRLRNSKREQKDAISQSSSGSPVDDSYSKDGLNSASLPARNSVLQACTVTSALIAALGLGVRQASHVAASAGFPILDCTAQVSFGFEIWHLELIAGSVVLISSSRYLLLKAWPDFAKSSEAANTQVLTSLDPFDYLIVAFLSGVSEELLFRGALLPLFGLNWKSALVAAAVFGILHVGNGRNYSFAAWATFVGLAYGYTTISSSSMVVPMTSHALNNLVGAVLWSYTSKSSHYVDQLSRSLNAEYKAQGIDVQCQVPLYVATKMVSTVTNSQDLPNPSLFTPTPQAYAKVAVSRIGYEPRCTPYWAHALQWRLVALAPDSLLDAWRLSVGVRRRLAS